MTKLNYRHLDQNYSFVNIYTLVRLQSPSVQSQPHLHKAYTKHTQSTQDSGTERSLIRWNSCKYQLNFKKRALMVFENSNFVFYSTWLFCQVNKLEIMKNFCNFTIKYYIDSKFVQQNVIIKWKWKKKFLVTHRKNRTFLYSQGFYFVLGSHPYCTYPILTAKFYHENTTM